MTSLSRALCIPLLVGALQLFADSGGNPPPTTAPRPAEAAGAAVITGNISVPGGSGDPDTPAPVDIDSPASIARDLSRSPLFAVTTGLASILGLLITLYATQVRTIPFSLYRSLMWRKAILLSCAGGLFVFGGVKFYEQDQAPSLPPFRDLHALLLGELRVSPADYLPHGPSLWALICLSGVILSIVGVNYDPPGRARRLLIREQQALHEALQKQVSLLLGHRKAAELEPPDDRVLEDTIDYYRHLQWRFSDVVLGPPPPTFPLSYQRPRSPLHDKEDDT